MRWGAVYLGMVGLAVACATGSTDDNEGELVEDDGRATASTGTGSGGASSTSSSSSASSTTSASSSSSGAGGMEPMCTPPEHLCGGMCVGNTPETGCTNSVDCSPCPLPSGNGTAICTQNGDCSLMCDQGYNPVGNDCVCANQCCSDDDCASNEVCTSNGNCTSDCSLSNVPGWLACQAICALISQTCVGTGSCTCQ